MKYAFIILNFLVLNLPTFATSKSNDQDQTDNPANPLSAEELQARLSITGEVFVFDTTGEKVISKASERRGWKFGNPSAEISSDWSSESNEFQPIALRHEWKILPDGRLRVKLSQFERILKGSGDAPIFKNLLKTEELIVKDFGPVVWRSVADQEKRVIVRFSISLPEEDTDFTGEVPLAGSGMRMYDNLGQIWASHFSIEGKYIGVVTHKGAVFLSLYPFPGSKVIGGVSGNLLTIGQLDQKRALMIESQTAYLPTGIHAKVYGIVRLDLKTPRLTSNKFQSTNDEAKFLSKIKNLE